MHDDASLLVLNTFCINRAKLFSGFKALLFGLFQLRCVKPAENYSSAFAYSTNSTTTTVVNTEFLVNSFHMANFMRKNGS